MFMKNISKNTKMALGAIVIVIIAALLVRYGGKKPAPVEPEVAPVLEQNVAKESKSYKAKPVVTAPVDTRDYTELIAVYKDRLVQFGDSCQVRMSKQVYKVGSEILLDNRNGVPLSIKLGSNSYDLGAYGHKVVVLGTEGEFMIDCGASQNVATLTVQK